MIYEITNNGISARVDSLGAQLISFMDEQGTEYIWQRNPKVWSSCSPLLFPIIGNLRDGKTIIGGKVWEMPKHGFTRNTQFHLLNRTESSVTLGMSDSDFRRTRFPLPSSFPSPTPWTERLSPFSLKSEIRQTGNFPSATDFTLPSDVRSLQASPLMTMSSALEGPSFVDTELMTLKSSSLTKTPSTPSPEVGQIFP